MENTSFKRFKLRYFILMFIVFSVISGILGAIFIESQYGSDITALILGGSLTLYMLYQWQAHRISFSESTIQQEMTNKRWGKYIGFSLFIKVVGILVVLLAGALILYFFKDTLSWLLDFINELEVVGMTPLSYIFFFVSICIFAPLWEELFFRGILLRRFMMKWKVSTSIIVSSLIFGLLHFGGSSMLHAAIFGAFMAYAYLKTKTIWVPIILHSVSNLFSFITLFIPGSNEVLALPTDSEVQQLLWTSSILLALSLGIFLYIIIRNWHKVREIPKIVEPVYDFAVEHQDITIENQEDEFALEGEKVERAESQVIKEDEQLQELRK